MLKRDLLKSVMLTTVVICVLILAACGSSPAKESTEQAPSQTDAAAESSQSVPASSVTEPEPEPKPEQEPETEPETEEGSTEASSETPSDVDAIAKINGGADEVGIYSVVVKLSDQAADKGVVEMVYYGSKGSPQENSVVNTFRIEYYKESDGTFEISTFYDGEVYQNQHHKDEVKVVNTFGATLRAGSVIISYTPDGGDTQEIFRADAEYFRSSGK